jgi:hypothetical protein
MEGHGSKVKKMKAMDAGVFINLAEQNISVKIRFPG